MDHEQSQSPKNDNQESKEDNESNDESGAAGKVATWGAFGALAGFIIGDSVFPDGWWVFSSGVVIAAVAVLGAVIGSNLCMLNLRMKGSE